MAEALKIGSLNDASNHDDNTTAREKVERTFSEELIIGICAPIGTDKDRVMNSIVKRLKHDYGYECERIRLSEFIRTYDNEKRLDSSTGQTSAFTNLSHTITRGDNLRNEYKNSILAELAIQKIHVDRAKKVKEEKPGGAIDATDYVSRRKCYIIDSLKNKEELMLFRAVYRELFYFFSIYSPLDVRKTNLLNKDLAHSEVDKLIGKDAGQGIKYGQDVRNTFVLGDFFLRIGKDTPDQHIDARIERYLHLIFDTKIITPTTDETAMYKAKSASGNSACLSRQVGAAVTDSEGHMISVGWNDVPKFGGNLYQNYGDTNLNDHRCMNSGDNGMCHNDFQKNELSRELLQELVNEGLISGATADSEKAYNIIRNSKVKSLIEYSRSVHAEMHAIIVGSQLSGEKMKKGKLFCTTYPCHNCARHIIVAGIEEVYYIEPYEKSLCITLHSDAITENETEEGKVRILVFDGVAPNRYMQFFTMSDNRKNKQGEGSKNKELKLAKPKAQLSLQAIPTLEMQALFSLNQYDLFKS